MSLPALANSAARDSSPDASPSKTLAPGVAVLLAAFASKTRLIDNFTVGDMAIDV